MPTHDFSGKSVLITGAASGIGRAASLAFARAGAHLILADIDAEGGEATAVACFDAGAQARFERCDVTQSEAVWGLVGAAVTAYGRLDVAFNNAGVEEEAARLADGDEALFDRVMGVNVRGVWLCLKHELAQMSAQGGGGAIVNTASVAGLVGAPWRAIYAASKHAVVGLTKSAAAEYGKAGIRINAICPGVIDTPMMERAFQREPRREKAVPAIHPIGRVGTPDEIAAAALWLASDAASFVTGACLAVDGGLTAI